ncbi:MAG: rod shape-determining protein [Chitinophagales bacterium]|jgi:rod shape-determining protein MreB|nr:rod shape-determining protein [Bacteroidota bacterium]MBP9880529.1 rod shape-determining protein [Chitinophagales bacterium]MBK9505983.1 rod shape-determining protein [Bacteroidota bacterium]MBL0279855.1 rod shape-determining protein [Bacteroidota bacterium]HRF76209.1 rod shape-determining protein [Chitinophagales bacterium]
MGIFNFLTQEIAIDLGTANTLIIAHDKVMVDEPSIVAIDRKTEKVIAVGKRAMQMHEKTHENIKTIRPLRDGVIADFQAAESMIRGMISMIFPKNKLFKPSLVMVICIPSGITEVEKRAVKDSAEQAGAREAYLIHEPMAAALGIGLDVQEPVGNMIIDIGGGTTEIAVVALSGIVCDQSIRVAGDEFTADIVDYMRRQHNLLIGERTAEAIKINVGSALTELDEAPEDYQVSGRDLMTGIPKQLVVTYSEIAHSLDKSISKIEEAILKALETTPPELASDIQRNGIYLTGGGALLRGLDKRISQKTKLMVHVADDPLKAVVRGTGIALKNREQYAALLMS